jgi:hypothetical protein
MARKLRFEHAGAIYHVAETAEALAELIIAE